MNELTLRLSDGTLIVVPASLTTITTYVLLEQEAWFEKEPAFLSRWLQPGMTVIDIGASFGVYSLSMARRVGRSGHVYAYEPGSEARGFLEKGREKNNTGNLSVIAAALSDRSRDGRLVSDWSSELHHLGEGEKGERVRITSLDDEDRANAWPSPEFIKIDAEGEEQRIIAGGRTFFTRHSPLVMFETKVDRYQSDIGAAFRALGYAIYRHLPGAPVLVPVGPADALDPYELNLFAAKPDRAAALARDGWLADAVENWSPDDNARGHALDLLSAQAFAPDMAALFDAPIEARYRDALAGYAMWRSVEAPLPRRCGALLFAFRALCELCASESNAARLSTFVRVASELGERKVSANAAERVLILTKGRASVSEPFWPAAARFDALPPEQNLGAWLMVAVAETLERSAAYSSLFMNKGVDLDWLCRQPFVSAEMERRRVLKAARAGSRIPLPARLCRPAEDHLNADIWRSGAVPNTLPPAR
jgi:FkbM family methyltransferase